MKYSKLRRYKTDAGIRDFFIVTDIMQCSYITDNSKTHKQNNYMNP